MKWKINKQTNPKTLCNIAQIPIEGESIMPGYLYIKSSMVTQSDYVTQCDIYCCTVTQHPEIKYVVRWLILVLTLINDEPQFHAMARIRWG